MDVGDGECRVWNSRKKRSQQSELKHRRPRRVWKEVTAFAGLAPRLRLALLVVSLT